MKCTNCGQELNLDDMFCPYCGEKQVVKPEMTYCPNCSCQIEKGMMYCPSCGKNLKNQNTSTNEPTVSCDVFEEIRDIPSEKKKKLKIATILGLISSIATLLTALFSVFLPIYGYNYYETVGEERVLSKESYSLFTSMISIIKSLSSANKYVYLSWIWFLIRIMFVIVAVGIIISCIKDSIEKVKRLIKFEKYCNYELHLVGAARSAQELTKQAKKAFNKNKTIYLITGLALMIFLGYGNIIEETIIAIAILAIFGYIIEKVANTLKKQAIKHDY